MRTLALMILLIHICAPTLAQTNAITMPLTGAYDITVPRAWEVDSQTSTGYYWKTPESLIRIRTYTPYFLVEFAGDEQADLALLSRLVTETFGSRSFAEESLSEVSIGPGAGIGYRFESIEEGVRFERQVYLFEMEDGTVILAWMKPLDGFDLDDNDVDALLAALPTINRRPTYAFYDGAGFDLSDTSWRVMDEFTLGIAGVSLSSSSVTLQISYWPRYASIAGFEKLRDFLGFIWDANYSAQGRYSRSNATDMQIAGFPGIFYPFEASTVNDRDLYERGVFVFELTSNKTYVTARVMTPEINTNFDEVYAILDTFIPGNRLICPLFARPGISIREEPSTSSARVRQTDEETLIAQSETTGRDGFRWFYVGEGWIRSDVIFFEINTCRGLPVQR